MAEKRVRVSDISGEEIPEGTGATVTIRFTNGSADRRADVTDAEAKQFGGKEVARRGRKPAEDATAAATATEEATA